MNLFESLRTCFKKFIDPVGRARRSEFWWYALFAVAVILVLNLVSRWFYSDVVVTICNHPRHRLDPPGHHGGERQPARRKRLRPQPQGRELTANVHSMRGSRVSLHE